MSVGDCGITQSGIWWRSRGTGPGVVLLNGYGASGAAWPRDWLAALALRYTVVTPDVRGGGWSRFAPVPFTIADLAGDVVAVLDGAGLDRAVLLGLSMGGMVAQETALVARHRVAGLVVAASRPPAPAFVPPPMSSSLAFLRGPGGRPLADFQRRLWTTATAPGFAERRPDLVEELVAQSVERPTPRSLLLQQLRAMTGWGHPERLTGLDVPTAVVHGLQDRFSVPANGRAVAGLIPGATLRELEGVGHLLPLEAPGALDTAIDATWSHARTPAGARNGRADGEFSGAGARAGRPPGR